MYKKRVEVKPFGVFYQFLPVFPETFIMAFKDLELIGAVVIGTVVIIKNSFAIDMRAEQTSPALFGTDVEIEFFLHIYGMGGKIR